MAKEFLQCAVSTNGNQGAREEASGQGRSGEKGERGRGSVALSSDDNVVPDSTPPPPSITTTQPCQSSSWHPHCTYCRTHY
ncbi:hypothetical protein PAXRUDRAFT_831576 [Paxillus rubicundulus Ve08.2h10]|uniref:Uncharacterized protein n=1 Tax=Paxillus rubicundulus Ve08.2h10 TaxID=930991 RepID=A0A0D0DI32_9AGAM|nr:hypothetical protein PAXRUDRAFT_831576 [Paxillus rubicundulus Ve08.2h10]